jgi:5-methylcytosine-specific restriction protein A
MARLTARPSRLASIPTRLGVVSGDTKAADRSRYSLKPWRAWYSRKAWKDLRREKIRLALGVCEQTGVALVGAAGAPNSPVVDHIRDHNGDKALFYDLENLQLVSKKWHDTEKQRIERARHG